VAESVAPLSTATINVTTISSRSCLAEPLSSFSFNCLKVSIPTTPLSFNCLRAELADMPWEFLFDPQENRFLAQSHLTPVVRYTGLTEIPPISVKLPLRVLLAISSPSDYEKLDVEGEISRLRQALMPLIKAGRVQVKGVKHATFEAILNILRKETFHIFHFIGHGGFDTQSDEGRSPLPASCRAELL
jgi:hypothetical protein